MTISTIANGLSEAQRDDLTANWNAFADADPLLHGRDLDAFLRDMEMAGFITWRAVEPDDLEDPFAAERGIEPDGSLWTLTLLGLAVREYLRSGK